jgi:hypothetical protein
VHILCFCRSAIRWWAVELPKTRLNASGSNSEPRILEFSLLAPLLGFLCRARCSFQTVTVRFDQSACRWLQAH